MDISFDFAGQLSCSFEFNEQKQLIINVRDPNENLNKDLNEIETLHNSTHADSNNNVSNLQSNDSGSNIISNVKLTAESNKESDTKSDVKSNTESKAELSAEADTSKGSYIESSVVSNEESKIESSVVCNEESKIESSIGSNANNKVEKKIDRRFTIAGEKAAREALFEENKHLIYDFKNGEMIKWERTKDFWAKSKISFGIGAGQTVYLAAKRYGISKNYIKPPLPKIEQYVKEVEESVEEKDDEKVDKSFVTSERIPDGPLRNGDWLLDIDGIEEFQNKGKKGIISHLRSILWFRYRYPCNFHFNQVRTMYAELIYDGYCKGCQAKFEISTSNQRKVLRVRMSDFDSKFKHTGSHSYITGQFKSEILEKLKTASPVVVQSQIANELKDNLDGHCPLVVPLRNLHQIKSRQKMKEKVFRDENSILAISKMKYEPQYFDCIEDIGIDPMYVYYTTPLQKAFTRSESRKKWLKISIDATGIAVHLPEQCTISERTGTMKRVYQYTITLHLQKSSNERESGLPVYQMISQWHSSEKIAHWLRTWKIKHLKNHFPNEIILDESAALLLSCVQAFTYAHSVHEYLSQCYECLFEKGKRPKCYIRLDISHTVASIKRNKIFDKEFGKQKASKEYYQRLLGFLLQQSDIKVVEIVIRNAFTLLYTELLSHETQQLQLNMIALTNSHEIDEEDVDCETGKDIPDKVFSEKKSKFYNWIEKLSEEQKIEVENQGESSFNAPNILYAPTMDSKLIDIFAKLPMTSRIMSAAFDRESETATSSSTEAGFRVLKKNVFAVSGKYRCKSTKIFPKITLIYIVVH